MGQHGSLLGKDGSAHDFFRARLDALEEEEDHLLTESISLGNTRRATWHARMSSRLRSTRSKRTAAPADQSLATIRGSIGSSRCEDGLSAAAAAPPLFANHQRSGGAQSPLHTPSSADVSKGGKDMEDNKASSFCT